MIQRTLDYSRASWATNVGGAVMRIEISRRVVRGLLTVGRVARARRQPGDPLR